MADRSLALKIVVDDADAKAKLKSFDAAVDTSAANSKQAAVETDAFNSAMQRIGKGHLLATQATVGTAAATGKLTATTAAATVAMSGVAGTLFATAAATTAVGTASTLAASAVGFFSTALGIIGGPIGIAVILATTAITQALKKYVESSGEAALKAEEHAAKQDTITRALELGAKAGISYKDAINFVTEADRHRIALMPEVAAQRWIASLTEQTTKAAKVRLENEALAVGLEKLGIVQGFTADAGKILTDEYDKAQTAARKAEAETKKFREETERLTGKVRELESGLFRVPDALRAIGRSYDEAKLGDLARDIERVEQTAHIANFGFRGLADGLEQVGMQAQFADGELEKLNAIFGFTGPTLDMLDTKTKGFVKTLGDFLENIPKGMGAMQDTLAGTLTEMFGGGGRMQSIISGGLNLVFGPLTGIVTQLVTQGMKKMGELVWDGLQKIGGFFKDLFGGPSADELAGRELVDKFEDHIATMLTEAQKIEAGNEEWKQTVIFLRDEYLKMGLSEADALLAAEKLWASSRSGAEAAKAAIAEIERALNGTRDAAHDAAAAVAGVGGGGGVPDRGDPDPYHRGGVVLPFAYRAHRGLAVDEVPIIAQRGEGVLSRVGMRRLGGASALNALNGGGTAGGGTVNTTVYVDGDINSPAARAKLARVVNDVTRKAVEKRGRVA